MVDANLTPPQPKYDLDICDCYSPNILHLIFPSNSLWYKICSRSDRIKLFLMSIIRASICILFITILWSAGIVSYRSFYPGKIILLFFLISCTMFHLISATLSTLKQPVYNERDLEDEIDKIVEDKLDKFKIRIKNDKSYYLV